MLVIYELDSTRQVRIVRAAIGNFCSFLGRPTAGNSGQQKTSAGRTFVMNSPIPNLLHGTCQERRVSGGRLEARDKKYRRGSHLF